MEKTFYTQTNIGKVKYLINFYNGGKHKDGSKFYNIRTFKNKKDFETSIRDFETRGYTEKLP